MTATTHTRNGTELTAVDVQPGQVYETSSGERVEIVHDDHRGHGNKVLEVRYPERTQLDEDGNEVVATAYMSRYSFADMATFDGFTRVETDADLDGACCDHDDTPEEMAGEWNSTPTCPICSRFMSRDFDGFGLPAAQCSRMDCEGFMDANELIDLGHFEEGED